MAAAASSSDGKRRRARTMGAFGGKKEKDAIPRRAKVGGPFRMVSEDEAAGCMPLFPCSLRNASEGTHPGENVATLSTRSSWLECLDMHAVAGVSVRSRET